MKENSQFEQIMVQYTNFCVEEKSWKISLPLSLMEKINMEFEKNRLYLAVAEVILLITRI